MAVRTLPTRWIPAATLWTEGALVEEIANMYRVQPRLMSKIVTKLSATYPRSFPKRGVRATCSVTVVRTVPIMSLKQKVVSALSGVPTARPAPFRRLRAV